MRITTQHLDGVRALLLSAIEQLENARKAANAAEESRLQLDGRARLLQGAFDVCAASYAQDTELSEAQLNDLPPSVQRELGYEKPEPLQRKECMTIQTILAERFTGAAVDAMAEAGNRLIEELALQTPVEATLHDQCGERIARFVVGSEDPGEQDCNSIVARLRSQLGASLRLRDARGVEAEVLLVIAAGGVQ